MPLPDLPIFIPQRFRSADQSQMDLYNQQIADYQTAQEKYQQQVDAYNAAAEEYNKGSRNKPFDMTAPVAPEELSFTQEDLDQFQGDVQNRAARDQANMTRAVRLVKDPSAYGVNLAGFSFAQGGVVPDVMSGIGSLGMPGIFLR